MLIFFENIDGKPFTVNPDYVVGTWLDEHDNVVIGTAIENFIVPGTLEEINEKLSGFVSLLNDDGRKCFIATKDVSAIYESDDEETVIRFRNGELAEINQPIDQIHHKLNTTVSSLTNEPVDAF
ncbi:MAG: hypothetical protein WC284_09275 [Candidimonas sp.]